MWLIPLSIITVITTLVLAFYSSIIQIQYSNVDGYQLRSRTYIFARQISFGFINASIFISALYNWNGSRYFLDNFDSITVFVSLSLSVYSDGVNNIHNELVKSYWLCNYLFILVYFIAQYLWNETLFSLMHMILFALGISFTGLDVLLPNIKMQIEKPSIEYTCGLFDFFTFSYLNKSLIQPNMNKSMEFNDIPSLIDADTTSYCWRQISYRLNDMSLMYNLILSVKYDLMSQFVYELISSLLEVSAPISLQIIISYVNNTNSSSLETVLPFNLSSTGAIIVLFTCSFLRGITEGQNYNLGRHIGIKVKSSLIAAIYNKSLTIDLSSYEGGSGKINNLISADVSSIQGFCAYFQQIWSIPFDIFLCMTMLYLIMGITSLYGLASMVFFLIIGVIVSKKLKDYQKAVLSNKDNRLNVVNEILNGIRIIKLFSWEEMFLLKLNNSRKIEIDSLRICAYLQCVSQILWEIVPTAVACTAFLVHVYVYKRKLTESQGFAALTLFSMLRFPLASLPNMISSLINALISLNRIDSFLKSRDVNGLRSNFCNNNSSPGNSMSEVVILLNDLSLGWLIQESVVVSNTADYKYCFNFVSASKTIFYNAYRYFMTNLEYFSESSNRKYAGTKYNLLNRNDENNNDLSSKLNKILEIPAIKKSFSDNSSSIDRNIPLIDSDIERKMCVSKEQTVIVEDRTAFKLPNVNLKILRGQLTVIYGSTGAGKSTLLSGILGECSLFSGNIAIRPDQCVAYVPQSAWIQNTTLKQNILFGNEFLEDRYKKVLFACALVPDIASLPQGDSTEIGEKGINLSGGQQQRVSLARAAYACTEDTILILDDPLSAVDTHVGQHVVTHLLNGLLSTSTRLLVTHQIALVAPLSNQIFHLDRYGKLSVQPKDFCVSRSSPNAKSLDVPDIPFNSEIDTSMCSSGISSLSAISILNKDKFVVKYSETSEVPSGNLTSSPSVNSLSFIPASTGNTHSRCQPPDSSTTNDVLTSENHLDSKLIDITIHALESNSIKSIDNGTITTVETKQSGKVKWEVYRFYIAACGGIGFAVVLLLVSICIAFSGLSQNYTLGKWMNALESGNISDKHKYLEDYLFSILFVLVAIFSRSILQATINLSAATKIHLILSRRIVLATISWFDSTPLGRIVNRFSQDISTVDQEILSNLLGLLDCVLGTIQIIFVISVAIPMLFPILLPVVAFTTWVAYQYIQVSRELKRLESLSKSPVFILLSETLQGLSVIRSFQQENRFFSLCCKRVDLLNRCHLYLWQTNRWLNFRMQSLGSVVAGFVGVSVLYLASHHKISGTAAGLALIYSLTFTNNLTFLARAHADVQMSLNSIERIQEYSCVEIEKYYQNNLTNEAYGASCINKVPDNEHQAPDDWPRAGEVEFRNVCMKYLTSASCVLNNISFKVPAGKKIGIVGRTGAGKSSLISALFRTVESLSGELLIDGINVFKIPLMQLRTKLAIVPQDPILFQGSVRSNVDPFGLASDEDIWTILGQVHLSDHVSAMPGGTGPLDLNGKIIADKGSNLSVGQRQLLCLARALIRKNKVLVLDECTANVDHITDALIQETVRNTLSETTVICIAHRLHTIAFYDIVMVMDKGRVAEHGSPLELMQNKSTIFHDMCKKSGDYDMLLQIAQKATPTTGINS